MPISPVVIDVARAVHLLTTGAVEWKKDVGWAIVARLRHETHGDILLHMDAMGGNYYVAV